jgi:hypothetical protein
MPRNKAKHTVYMRRWREEQRRKAWFPRFGSGVEGTYTKAMFLRDAGGPDTTQLGGSLLEFATYGFGAPSQVLMQLSAVAGAIRTHGTSLGGAC